MRITNGEETERMWLVLDDKEKIVQVFYNKQKAADYVKQKEKTSKAIKMARGITLKKIKHTEPADRT